MSTLGDRSSDSSLAVADCEPKHAEYLGSAQPHEPSGSPARSAAPSAGGSRRTTHDYTTFDQYIAEAIDSALERVWLKVPWFSSEHVAARPILEALVRARYRQMDVRIITRPEASNSVTLQTLVASKIPTRTMRYLHEKELIIDGRLLTFSANFTQPELRRNSNTSYEIADPYDRASAEDAFLMGWEADQGEASAGEEAFVDAAKVVPDQIRSLLGREQLNPLQAMVLPAIFGSERSVIVAAPTGSGKTAIGEAAILKAIVTQKRKAVYITPSRALTKELGTNLERWRAAGITSVTLTGDVDVDSARIQRADLWIATTEKFEGLFRKSSMAQAMAEVGCVVVDEIHFLGDDSRGPLLEALLARLRLLAVRTRLIGLSATVTNAADLAKWLDASLMRSTWRPIQLTVQVLGYPQTGQWLTDELTKDDVASQVVDDMTASGGQVVVFCGSKAKARRAAAVLAGIPDSDDEEDVGRQALIRGVGLHFRGISVLQEAERQFRSRLITKLVATTTLAQGVNLPARAVIIRDTTLGKDPMTTGTALQMAGRAGRAGQETEGYAYLLAPDQDVAFWRQSLLEGHAVHSKLLDHLHDHILAEILLGRINSAEALRDWYSGTFAAWENGDRDQSQTLDTALEDLVIADLVRVDNDGDTLVCTALGALTSRFQVDVASAVSLLREAKSLAIPSGARDAEVAVLVSLASRVNAFSTAYVAPGALKDARALLPPDISAALRADTTPGTVKSLTALLCAIDRPTALERPGKYGPFSTSDLRDLVGEAPRYLTWLGATGRVGAVDWIAPVSVDLAARIEWRSVRPPRGSGRLIRLLERVIPHEQRRKRLPGAYMDLSGQPDALLRVPRPAGSQGGQGRVQPIGLEARAAVDEEAIRVDARIIADGSPPVRLFVRGHRGSIPTFASVEPWTGTPVALPQPIGSSPQIAVDVLAIGDIDWAWSSSVITNGLPAAETPRRLRELASKLAPELLVLPNRGFLEPRGRWLARSVQAAINSKTEPSFVAYANIVAGSGNVHERAWRIVERLRILSPPRPGHVGPLSAPTAVLQKGKGDSSSWALCLAALAAAAGIEAGIVMSAAGVFLPILLVDDQWRIIGSEEETASASPVVPRKLTGRVTVLLKPPNSTPPPAAEPVWQFLADFRDPGRSSKYRLRTGAKPATTRILVADDAPDKEDDDLARNIPIPAIENASTDEGLDGTVAPFDLPSTLSAQRRASLDIQQPGLLSRFPRAYSPWSPAEDEHLQQLAELGRPLGEISQLHRRHSGSITSRLKHLGLQ